ncbi:MAG TPA: 50S ribosomal protein L19 [Spirochaetota bacterium]|nr:50S ribosomal protein L19 [Spirochaetota bacterium]HOH37556.1 50S ribosomal protein L19 [Spirochaetota bacterium]HPJ15596.1 50S ribosomal protein L19 [Spirochaetota bacterium]HPM34344.1 50S ribosomal protein L19 [Spirochaetota bacterium]HPY02826.1 50S ribosomal protein L19 [Spirochaetota bacterium]
MNKAEQLGLELAQEKKVDFEIGDTIKVHYKIVEGTRERIQVYEGTVIAINNRGVARTFTVRRISYDVGVERVFPINSPRIAKIEITKKSAVRRSKLYFFRGLKGKASKLKERKGRVSLKSIPATTEAPAAVQE